MFFCFLNDLDGVMFSGSWKILILKWWKSLERHESVMLHSCIAPNSCFNEPSTLSETLYVLCVSWHVLCFNKGLCDQKLTQLRGCLLWRWWGCLTSFCSLIFTSSTFLSCDRFHCSNSLYCVRALCLQKEMTSRMCHWGNTAHLLTHAGRTNPSI